MAITGVSGIRVEKLATTTELRIYHTGRLLSMSSSRNLFFPVPSPDNENIPEDIAGPVATRLIKELNKIDGIKIIALDPCALTIVRKQGFYWPTIQPKILKAIKEVLATSPIRKGAC